MSICIFGSGGFAKEVYWMLLQCGKTPIAFIDPYQQGGSYHIPILNDDFFCPKKHKAVVAVGNPVLRKKIVNDIVSKHGDCFESIIHPSVNLMSPEIKVGTGAIICANCILTCNIEIGNHCHLNLATSIGHDFKAGDFFTTAPNATISGNIVVGDCVYFGANSSSKEKITITSNVVIGAGACVVKDILEEGIYIGVPAKKLCKTK